MKITGKLATLLLMAVLLLLPLQGAHAKGLLDGPIFGDSYTLKSGETHNSDLVVFGGSVSIEKDAKVNGAVVLFGGSFTLEGEVSKDVVVMGGAVKLGANAHIHGNLVTMGAPVDRDSGARVDGDVIKNPTRPETALTPAVPANPFAFREWNVNPIWNFFAILGQSLAFALLAILIASFLPNHTRRVADGVMTQPLVAFGIGLLTLILFIVLIVALGLFSVLIITLILTIPLIIVVSVIFAAGSALGWLAFGAEVGIRMIALFKRELPLPLAAGLGVFIVNLVTNIPVFGGLVSTLVGLAALGAVVLTRFGTRAATLLTPPAPVMSEAPAQN